MAIVYVWVGLIAVGLLHLPELNRAQAGERLAIAILWALAALYASLLALGIPMINMTQLLRLIMFNIYRLFGLDIPV